MSNTPAIYVYLDSKIHGAALQLIKYFETGVFCRESAIVLYKRYQESDRFFATLFKGHNVNYERLESVSRPPNLNGAVVYYPFNAQSNCRLVAERGARHVFVTHGESNKAASYKPIIRLYDYVVTAGNAGVDRYVNTGIFHRDEAGTGRIVRMGDTFVGSTGYLPHDGLSDEGYVLYAPTWEGGVPSEDYSSTGDGLGLTYTAAYAREHGVRRLIVQPHPNLGHRLPGRRRLLYRQIAELAREGFDIIVVDARCGWRDQWNLGRLARHRIKVVKTAPRARVVHAIADLSAMETQLLNDGIDYKLLLRELPQMVRQQQLLMEYYAAVGVREWQRPPASPSISDELKARIKEYYISYSNPLLAKSSIANRMHWLREHVLSNEYWKHSHEHA